MTEVPIGPEPDVDASAAGLPAAAFDGQTWRARRETMDLWGAAFDHGDAAEVERLVRQSRAERLVEANAGLLGQMLGQVPGQMPGQDESTPTDGAPS